jgi:predicted dehydrogenase
MRELLGMPRGVIYARWHDELPVEAPNRPGGGRYLTAAFDYGGYACHFETGVDRIPRFDGHLEVFGDAQVLRVQYDTPYVRNLPIRLIVTEGDAAGRATRSEVHPGWGDAFVQEWRAFYDNVAAGRPAKTSPDDFRQDLVLFQEMMAHIRQPRSVTA